MVAYLHANKKEETMTPEEQFMFDLDGYLVVKGVLNQQEIDELNALADTAWPGEYDEKGIRRTSHVSQWGPAAQRLMDHANIVPYLTELLGPYVRIDHDYSIFMQKGGSAGRLHGGPVMHGNMQAGDHWYKYHDGVMRNGLTVFTYCLSHAGPGDGGFGCVPGSHKSNFPQYVPDEVRSWERRAHYIRQVEVEAGDVIIFTEALMHGTVPWTANHERRSLLYKYSPGHSSWSSTYYNADDYPDVTEQQRRLMMPPSIGGREPTVAQEV
jgi:hypothetical protein